MKKISIFFILLLLSNCSFISIPYTPVKFDYTNDLEIQKLSKQVIVCAEPKKVREGELSVVENARKNNFKKVKLFEYKIVNKKICVVIYGE